MPHRCDRGRGRSTVQAVDVEQSASGALLSSTPLLRRVVRPDAGWEGVAMLGVAARYA